MPEVMLMLVIPLLLAVIGYLIIIFKPSEDFKLKKFGTLPPGSFGLPIIGETLQVLTGSHKW